jgi:hypothetical protein
MALRPRVLVAFVLALAAAGPLPMRAATTGSLAGRVVNAEGQPLAGVKITISSDALLGGARNIATGAEGDFIAPQLPPGIYEVIAELGGFVTQHVQEVPVLLDRTTSLDVTLSPGEFTASVEVVASPVVLDARRVALSDNFTTDYLKYAAVGSDNRTFQAVIGQAAGVTDVTRDVADTVAAGLGAGIGFNPLVLGSTVGENAYYVDGLENTDVVTGTFALNFNYDTIDEISFLKGGYEAEYGLASGGFVNLITKSGGNRFTGSLDVRYSDDSLAESGEFFDSDEQESEVLRPSLTVGGPAVVDRLWFFASIESIDRENRPRFASATRDFEGEDYLAKLSWDISPSWALVAKFFGESTDVVNVDAGINATPEAHETQEQNGTVSQVTVTGALGSRLLWDGAIGIQRGELNQLPVTGDFSTPGRTDRITGRSSENIRFANFDDRDRDLFKTSITWLADASGAHELKAGVELQDRGAEQQLVPTGGGFFFIDNIVPGRTGLAVDTSGGTFEVESSLASLYAQDAWDVADRFTLKLGLRWDQVDYENNVGTEVADLDRLAPRIGVAWQLTGDGRTVARASWGEFLDPSALYLPRITNTPRLISSDAYLSCTDFFGSTVTPATCSTRAQGIGLSGEVILDPFGEDPRGWFLLANAAPFVPNVIAPGLDPTFTSQLLLSIERMVGSRTLVELFYSDKDTEEIHESTCNGNVSNPASGAPCGFLVVDNLTPLTRDHEAVGLTIRSRVSARANLLASYTWSESEGSIEYTQSNQQDFDVFPPGFVNRFGLLSDHRLHRVKLNGYVTLPLDFNLAAGGFWSSDFHWTPITFRNGPLEYLDARGDREANDNYQLDLQLAKGFQAGRFRTELFATVFNVLDDERPIRVCQADVGCGGTVALGDPIAWQLPRRYEFGVRLELQ